MPSQATLAGLSVPQRIVAIAESQVGYSTEPSDSYCNKFSAYWDAGTAGCPGGETAEEWCADFAAWAWQKAGVQFTYGYGPGEINGAAVSFYEWGVANGQWHPATSGYVAAPGDVAVYGLSLGADPSAVHVAIVTDDAPGQPGPDVVNGDGDRTGFSVVETGTDQALADAGNGDSVLARLRQPILARPDIGQASGCRLGEVAGRCPMAHVGRSGCDPSQPAFLAWPRGGRGADGVGLAPLRASPPYPLLVGPHRSRLAAAARRPSPRRRGGGPKSASHRPRPMRVPGTPTSIMLIATPAVGSPP